MDKPTTPDARERVLIAADRLFMERGYKGVTLRDIADVLGIKHASLYYHAPGGKEQLFIEVTERNLLSHRIGLTAAMDSAGDDLRGALYAAAAWLLVQPPMDLIRMTLSDLREIAPDQSIHLGQLARECLLNPIHEVLRKAEARGDIVPVDHGAIAGALLSMLEGLHAVPDIAFMLPDSRWHGKTRHDMAMYLIDVLLRGLLPRPAASTQN